MWQLVHTCYGDELGLTSDDEDYVPPLPPPDDEKLSTRLSVESFSEVGVFFKFITKRLLRNMWLL